MLSKNSFFLSNQKTYNKSENDANQSFEIESNSSESQTIQTNQNNNNVEYSKESETLKKEFVEIKNQTISNKKFETHKENEEINIVNEQIKFELDKNLSIIDLLNENEISKIETIQPTYQKLPLSREINEEFENKNSIVEEIKVNADKLHRQRLEKAKIRNENYSYVSKENVIAEKAINDIIEENNKLTNLKTNFDSLKYLHDTTDKVTLNKSKSYENTKPKINSRIIPLSNINNDKNENLDFNDSFAIRSEIYKKWYENKINNEKEILKIKRNEEKNLENKKVIEAKQKEEKAEHTFKLWKEKKLEELFTKKKEKDLMITRNYENELKKKNDKRLSAEKAFEIWKERKDKYLKFKIEEKEKIAKNMKPEKNSEASEKAFLLWLIQNYMKQRKDEELHEKQKNEKKYKSIDKKINNRELSTKAYEDWLKNKENEKLMSNKSSMKENDFLPPFYPSSKTSFGR